MSQRYVIKGIYLEGPNKGRCYLIDKNEDQFDLGHTFSDLEVTFSNLRFAEKTCRRLTEENRANCRADHDEAWIRINHVFAPKQKDHYVYWHEAYFPIPVDLNTKQIDLSDFADEEAEYLRLRCFN